MTRLAILAAAVLISAAIHLAVLTTIAHAIDPATRAMAHVRATTTCTYAHGIDPSGKQGTYLPVAVRIRWPGIQPLPTGELIVKFSCRQMNGGKSPGDPYGNDWQYIGIGIITANPPLLPVTAPTSPGIFMQCEARFNTDRDDRDPVDVRAYRAIRRSPGVCPTGLPALKEPPHMAALLLARSASRNNGITARGGVFARGDRARIRAAVRRRARESGWRRVGRVEILSPSSVDGLSTANLLVWARKGGMGQCEAEAWWTPGYEPVIRAKDVLLDGTGSCVPQEDPR